VLDHVGSKDALVAVQQVIVGNVLGAGHGMNLARQIALDSGLSHAVTAFTVNQVCGSGLKSIGLGYESIRLGVSDCVLAGGVESMSQAAHVTTQSRWGQKMGSIELRDSMLSDGLTDAFDGSHMGMTAENLATEFNISREAQDAFAAESQRRAARARRDGVFQGEIVTVPLQTRGGPEVKFCEDEHIKPDTTAQGLAALRPAFKKDGTVTAGNASGINDGAAMVLLMSEHAVERTGCTPLARIVSVATAGVEPKRMGFGPVPACQAACAQVGTTPGAIDLVEANEAFAVQALVVQEALQLDPSRVNRWGGAIALGHPIGASGARVLTTLVHAMVREGVHTGLATLCIGGGQGIAMVLSRAGM
jgi:acetyl-CoA C-acetyltransferase